MKDKMLLGCITQLTDAGVKQTSDVLGDVTERFVNIRDAAFDKAIHQKLIEMGWTPPAVAGTGRAEAIKAGTAALKRETAWCAVDLSDADAERCAAAVVDAISPIWPQRQAGRAGSQ